MQREPIVLFVAEASGAGKVRMPKMGLPQRPTQNRQVSFRLIRPIGQMHLLRIRDTCKPWDRVEAVPPTA